MDHESGTKKEEQRREWGRDNKRVKRERESE